MTCQRSRFGTEVEHFLHCITPFLHIASAAQDTRSLGLTQKQPDRRDTPNDKFYRKCSNQDQRRQMATRAGKCKSFKERTAPKHISDDDDGDDDNNSTDDGHKFVHLERPQKRNITSLIKCKLSYSRSGLPPGGR